MLHAIYKGNYTFYVSTEDMRFDSSVPTTQLRYLFQFTNDMDGRVAYAYGQNQVVHNRYTKVTFSHNTTEDVFLGRVNFVPNGYWKYKVYEVSADASLASISCANAPASVDSSGEGILASWKIVKMPDTLISSGNFTGNEDTEDTLINQHSIADLDAGTYVIRFYDSCGALVSYSSAAPNSSVGEFIINEVVTQSSGAYDEGRWMFPTSLIRTPTGINFQMHSHAPVGYTYSSTQAGVPGTITTTITSQPQITTHTFTQTDPPSSANNLIEYEMLDSLGNAVMLNPSGTEIIVNIRPAENPFLYYGVSITMMNTDVSITAAGVVKEKGIATFNMIYGASAESLASGYWVLQGLVEEGKLYIEEPAGEEQVQYTQNNPASGTNYIYYGQ